MSMMWVVAMVLVFFLLWRSREGLTNDTPSDAAYRQSGDLRYLKKKIDGLAVLTPSELDAMSTKIAELELNVGDLEVRMSEFIETKKLVE